ncbi:MAG: hypothetical protein L6Q84_04470 [Polyangiaceae bacterium]|nr:hypothetical protein [Polyangiaceae bacterium]
MPSGDLATLLELGLDLLIAEETKRRSGAGKPRKRRETKPDSRHVPVNVQRAVRERDGDQCTFTDAEGRRCSEKRFLTIEHIEPFAKGWLASWRSAMKYTAATAVMTVRIEPKLVDA